MIHAPLGSRHALRLPLLIRPVTALLLRSPTQLHSRCMLPSRYCLPIHLLQSHSCLHTHTHTHTHTYAQEISAQTLNTLSSLHTNVRLKWRSGLDYSLGLETNHIGMKGRYLVMELLYGMPCTPSADTVAPDTISIELAFM